MATFKERYKLYEVQLLESNLAAQGTPLRKPYRGGSVRTSGSFQEGVYDYKICLNTAFSHDVTSAILVFQINEKVAMLVFQTSPLGLLFQ